MDRARDGFVTVVSGVPRSGTSLVMQMLAAGGLPPLVDDQRPADRHNPRGYFEYAPVRSLPRDGDWVRGALGRAVKVVHALVPALPDGIPYRVLLIERDAREVVGSQRRMLGGAAEDPCASARLAETYREQVAALGAWLARRPGFRTLHLRHADLLREPARVASEVDLFLGGGLDRAAMAAVVVPTLYRTRLG